MEGRQGRRILIMAPLYAQKLKVTRFGATRLCVSIPILLTITDTPTTAAAAAVSLPDAFMGPKSSRPGRAEIAFKARISGKHIRFWKIVAITPISSSSSSSTSGEDRQGAVHRRSPAQRGICGSRQNKLLAGLRESGQVLKCWSLTILPLH